MADDRQQEWSEFVGFVKARLDAIDSRVTKLDAAVSGNGKSGIVERLSKQETATIEINKDLDRVTTLLDNTVKSLDILSANVGALSTNMASHLNSQTGHPIRQEVVSHMSDPDAHLPSGLLSKKNITIIFFVVSLISLSWIYGGPALELIRKFAGF